MSQRRIFTRERWQGPQMKNAACESSQAAFQVEAGRIALPSRDTSTAASTRVVDNLGCFASKAACRRAASVAIPKRCLVHRVSGMAADDPELVTGFQATPAVPISQGRVLLRSHCEVFLGN